MAVVEENLTVREGLQTIINLSPGCQCVGAWSTANQTLAMLPTQDLNVILIDLELAVMGGGDFAARIKEQQPSAHIILLTVYEDPERIFRGLQAGASGYLLKRSTPEQILAAIRGVHQHSGGRDKNSSVGELGRTPNRSTLSPET